MGSSVSYINSSGNVGERNNITQSGTSLSFTVKEADGDKNMLNNSTRALRDPSPKKDKNGKIIYKPSVFKSTKKSAAFFNANPLKNMSAHQMMDNLNKSIFVQNNSDTVYKDLAKSAQYYNRYKMPTPNDALQKGFAHVFFVRPSCNILDSNYNMMSGLSRNETFSYANQSAKWLLKELVASNGQPHDFMMLPSNYVAGFSLSDEYINTDSYGKTYTGYKIAYGKSSIESKTAGTLSITFNDDRDLHIYQLHRLWVEYINGVYRGEISPLSSNIKNKILDYVGACYYILTAEDGETIIFWSKYYGIFPTQIPSSQYSWGAGNIVSAPQLEMQYNFSFKEDYNPYSILEFNYNSRCDVNGTSYVPIYDNKLGHAGSTWVGEPFIELQTSNSGDHPYVLKLRFRPKR